MPHANGERATQPEIEAEYIYLDYRISGVPAIPSEPQDFSQTINAKVFAVFDPNNNLTEIGYVTAVLIRICDAENADFDIETILDAKSEETFDCALLFDDGDYSEALQKAADHDLCPPEDPAIDEDGNQTGISRSWCRPGRNKGSDRCIRQRLWIGCL